MTERVHVTPNWEQHEESPDCWCEPSLQVFGCAALVVHHAMRCSDGRPHSYTLATCTRCGQALEDAPLQPRERRIAGMLLADLVR